MFSVTSFKMLEYCGQNNKGGPVKTPEAAAADLGTGDMEKWMQIAAEYGISDMDISESGGSKQTYKDKYHSTTIAEDHRHSQILGGRRFY
jgi:hypothetical protein